MAGLLGDIYSYGDTLKRKVKGLMADPLGSLELGVRRFGEDQNDLLNLMSNAYPMAGDKTVLNSPQQIAGFRKQLADKASEQAIAAATVWHGSPHKFDKFDSSKIGTGEGAQAYGHGLYLAESPDVAKQYAGMNPASSVRVLPNGKQFDVVAVHDSGPLREVGTFSSKAEAQKVAGEYTGANHYKVDLPDEHIAKMLDWDRPLSQQHPDVQNALTRIGVKIEQTNPPASREAIEAAKEAFRLNPSRSNFQAMGKLMNDGQTGMGSSVINGNVLKGFTDANGMVVRPEDLLKAQGIPGIRYLDGGSRGAGQGSSNFVVFPGNEGLLSILERNGQPVGGLLK